MITGSSGTMSRHCQIVHKERYEVKCKKRNKTILKFTLEFIKLLGRWNVERQMCSGESQVWKKQDKIA
jgi:hypothetical protein